MKKTLLQVILGALFLMLACAGPGRAAPLCTASITLASDTITGTNGVFNYDVSSTCQITEDTNLVLGTASNGFLSGVNGESVPSASTLGMDDVIVSVVNPPTSTSVDFEALAPINPITLQGLLVIDCSSCMAGTVGWYIGASPEASGTVTGPVAAVTSAPEPATLLMLAGGLLALALVAGRKRAPERCRV